MQDEFARRLSPLWEVKQVYTVWQGLEAVDEGYVRAAIVDLNMPGPDTFRSRDILGGGFALVVRAS